MKKGTFSGGIHPPYFKEFTAQKETRVADLPPKVIIPLQQHTGAICEAKVKVGDKVKVGQKIGDSSSFVSAPVHASISGTVQAIEKAPHPLGKYIPAIVIESDGKDEWIDGVDSPREWVSLSSEEIKRIIREAGIVGLGGAAFPTHVKLSPPKEKPIDTIIINGCECEPYLTCDHRLMLERSADIVEGLKIILRAVGVSQGYIGIEDNKPEAISAMEKASLSEPNIRVVAIKTKYPQGAEKQLIKAVLNREVPAGGLPLDIGVIVNNVGTAIAVFEAVTKNKPLVERCITVTGSVKEPGNLRVRIGTLFKDVIDQCRGLVDELGKVIMGGPMTGIAQYTLDVPVIKGTSGILVLRKREVRIVESRPCIKCAKCVDICPMRLLPCLISIHVENMNFERAEAYRPLDCFECGACGYVCPAQRPLLHYIKFAKAEIMAKRAAKKAS